MRQVRPIAIRVAKDWKWSFSTDTVKALRPRASNSSCITAPYDALIVLSCAIQALDGIFGKDGS
jgi:hypothetical protein